MLTSEAIAEIVKRVAADTLRGQAIAGVTQEPTQDAVGEAAIFIRIVMPGDGDIPDGDAIGDTTVDVHRALEAAGEERSVMVSFGNEAELAELAELIAHGDP